MLNWALMRAPINWVTIVLMLMFAAFALHLLEQFVAPPVAA